MITDRDDLRHTPTPEKDFSESKWFSFYDGSQDFWASVRIGLEPNRSTTNRWVVLALRGEVLFRDLAVGLPLPASNWNDIEVGGLRVVTSARMRDYRLEFNHPTISLNVNWTAETPVFDYADCTDPLPPSLAAAHYEQSGRIHGRLRYQSRVIALDGWGHRDHSWGVRRWEGFRGWVAFMAPLGDGDFIHVERFDEQTSGVSVHGFLYQQGRNVPLEEADINFEFAAGGQFPSGFSLKARGVHGNLVERTGNIRLICPLRFGRCTVGESFATFSNAGSTYPGIVEYGFTE